MRECFVYSTPIWVTSQHLHSRFGTARYGGSESDGACQSTFFVRLTMGNGHTKTFGRRDAFVAMWQKKLATIKLSETHANKKEGWCHSITSRYI